MFASWYTGSSLTFGFVWPHHHSDIQGGVLREDRGGVVLIAEEKILRVRGKINGNSRKSIINNNNYRCKTV